MVEYDPYAHRMERSVSNFGAFLDVVKTVVGAGILMSPMAFRSVGWVTGILITALIGFLIVYCKKKLVNSMYELERRGHIPVLTYSETVFMATGSSRMSAIVDVAIFTNHFGCCCVYMTLIANCCKFVVDQYWSVKGSSGYMLLLMMPLILIYTRFGLEDKVLTRVANVGYVFLLFGFCIVSYFMCTNLRPFRDMLPFQEHPVFSVFVGATCFALDAPNTLVSLEANMANPKSYINILGIGVFITTIIQICFGFLGYMRYNHQIMPNILQNLPPGSTLALIAHVLISIGFLLLHPLQASAAFDISWNKHLRHALPDGMAFAMEPIYRACLVTLSVSVAMTYPNIIKAAAFVGALCSSVLTLILPSIVEICVRPRIDDEREFM